MEPLSLAAVVVVVRGILVLLKVLLLATESAVEIDSLVENVELDVEAGVVETPVMIASVVFLSATVIVRVIGSNLDVSSPVV